jgi:hypothetical protein
MPTFLLGLNGEVRQNKHNLYRLMRRRRKLGTKNFPKCCFFQKLYIFKPYLVQDLFLHIVL